MSENTPASPEASAAPWKLLQMMTGYWVTQALYVAAKLGIADLLREGPVNCDVLASKTSTHLQSLYRTLRALASVGVFTEVAQEGLPSRHWPRCSKARRQTPCVHSPSCTRKSSTVHGAKCCIA